MTLKPRVTFQWAFPPGRGVFHIGIRLRLEKWTAAVIPRGGTAIRRDEQIKRNKDRSPSDFLFQLSQEEKNGVVATCDHLRKLEFAKTLPVMSHHERVRKVLRDEIPKFPNSEKDTNTVRGISDGDELPAVVIQGPSLGCNSLSTDCRRMGRGEKGHESYTRGVLRLMEHYGPFRLAYFEALFRAADIRPPPSKPNRLHEQHHPFSRKARPARLE